MIVFSASTFSTVWGLVAALAYALGALLGGRLSPQQSRNYLWVISLFHGLSVLASLIPEPNTTPRFGFAPALSATAWLVLMVYTLEHHWFPQMKTRWVLSGAGLVAVLLPLFSRDTIYMLRPRCGCLCTGRWAWPPMLYLPLPWCMQA